jgi:hypothetical protein
MGTSPSGAGHFLQRIIKHLSLTPIGVKDRCFCISHTLSRRSAFAPLRAMTAF